MVAELTSRRCGGRSRAFSLVELVVVVFVIGVLASIAVPRFSSALARQRVDAAARRVVLDIQLGQRQARTSTMSQTISFDTGTSSYRLVGMKHLDRAAAEYKVSLSEEPYQATLVSADLGGDTEIIFDMYGMPDSGGSVVIRVGNHFRTVSVEPDTGEASVQ